MPPEPNSPGTFLDHDLYRGEDGEGNEYLLAIYHDGTRTVAVRPPGARTWGPPVLLRGVL